MQVPKQSVPRQPRPPKPRFVALKPGDRNGALPWAGIALIVTIMALMGPLHTHVAPVATAWLGTELDWEGAAAFIHHRGNTDLGGPPDKALLQAAHDGDARTARLCLHRGASVDTQEHEARGGTAVPQLAPSVPDPPAQAGKSALYLAVQAGAVDVVKLLLESGANVSLAGNDGHTPLHVAAVKFDAASVDLLLRHGANVSETDPDGLTPAQAALAWRHHVKPEGPEEEAVLALLTHKPHQLPHSARPADRDEL